MDSTEVTAKIVLGLGKEVEQLRALKADALELANYRAIDRGGGVSHD